MRTGLLSAILVFLIAALQEPFVPPPPPPPPPVRVGGAIPQMGNGVVDGVVRRMNDGEPLAGARVVLSGLPDRSGALSLREILSDSAGRFAFRNLPPADYTIRVSLENYYAPPVFGVSAAGATVSASVGFAQTTSSHTISLTPGGVISGSVRTPDGQPAANVSVAAVRATYRDGRKLLQFAKTVQSDDRGEFRLANMPPGEYYVRASANPGDATETYYPGAADPESAVLVTVRGGVDAPAGFRLSPPQVFRISGTVMNTIPELANDPEEFLLLPRDPKFIGPVATRFPNVARGRGPGYFEINGVRPGLYDLMPNAAARTGANANDRSSTASGKPLNYTGRVTIDVRDRDLQGVVVAVTRGADLSVQVNESAGPSGRLRYLGFGLRHIDLLANSLTSTQLAARPLSADGKMQFLSVPEGTYALTAPVGTPGFYIADIRQGARSIYDQGVIAVGKDSADPVEVVFAADGGSIGGTVEGSDKASGTIRVSLVPEGARRGNLLLYKRALLISGRFTLTDVPPGSYKLYAWEDLPAGADENADFMGQYEQRGRAVTVRAGVATPDVALPLIRR